jgi:hypothetical protein
MAVATLALKRSPKLHELSLRKTGNFQYYEVEHIVVKTVEKIFTVQSTTSYLDSLNQISFIT